MDCAWRIKTCDDRTQEDLKTCKVWGSLVGQEVFETSHLSISHAAESMKVQIRSQATRRPDVPFLLESSAIYETQDVGS